MCDRVVLRLFLGTGVPFSLVMPTDVLMYTVRSSKRTWTLPKLVKIHGICRCFLLFQDMFRLFSLQFLVVQMIFIHFARNFSEFPPRFYQRTLPLHHGFSYQQKPGNLVHFCRLPILGVRLNEPIPAGAMLQVWDVFVGRRIPKFTQESMLF